MDDSIASMIGTFIAFFGGISICAALYWCIYCCQKCKDKDKEIEEEMKSREINKSLQKKKDDWWVESGGPPVTNEGQVANVLEMFHDEEGPIMCECNQRFI